MKIAGTGPVQTSSVRRRTKSGGTDSAEFAEQLSAGRQTQSAAAPVPTGSIDGLFLLQEIDDEGRGKREARDYGEALLDRLDEIRDSLLTGALNTSTLNRLLDQVRARKSANPDPRLREILEEIELRAAVELAKFRRFS